MFAPCHGTSFAAAANLQTIQDLLIDALGEKPSIGDRGLNPGIAKALANERENHVHRFLIAMPEPGLDQVGRVGHTVFVFG
jgi:hypothetical protein